EPAGGFLAGFFVGFLEVGPVRPRVVDVAPSDTYDPAGGTDIPGRSQGREERPLPAARYARTFGARNGAISGFHAGILPAARRVQQARHDQAVRLGKGIVFPTFSHTPIEGLSEPRMAFSASSCRGWPPGWTHGRALPEEGIPLKSRGGGGGCR